MKAVIIIVVVLAVVVGGLLTLRRTRSLGMPDKETLGRVEKRAREQEAKDDSKS